MQPLVRLVVEPVSRIALAPKPVLEISHSLGNGIRLLGCSLWIVWHLAMQVNGHDTPINIGWFAKIEPVFKTPPPLTGSLAAHLELTQPRQLHYLLRSTPCRWSTVTMIVISSITASELIFRGGPCVARPAANAGGFCLTGVSRTANHRLRPQCRTRPRQTLCGDAQSWHAARSLRFDDCRNCHSRRSAANDTRRRVRRDT